MTGRVLLWALGILVGLPAVGLATLTVDLPLPITHRVTVQIIETALDNGTSPATIFGNATARADIEASVDLIWAQAGIDVGFLTTINRYDSTFALQGNDGEGERDEDDFDLIFDGLDTAGLLNPDESVINMVFVDVVPQFEPLSDSHAAGLASVGTNGINQYVGSTLLTFQNGRDAIAGVVAHEIGHNLGLFHAANGGANLMSPGGTTDQLTAAQISAVFQTTYRDDAIAYIPAGGTGFPQLIDTTLYGDYNGDEVVDGADYTVWRDTLGSTSILDADGNGNNVIDSGDYTVWSDHFGETAGSGGGFVDLYGYAVSLTVPEPSSFALLLLGLVGLVASRRNRT